MGISRKTTRVAGWIAFVASVAATGLPAMSADRNPEALEARMAIERVYWDAREWPDANDAKKPSFERGIDTDRVHERWQRVLAARELLRSRWGVEVTGEMLQRELHRLTMTTRDSSRLQALFSALDRDPRKIAEYLAQPLLVQRLAARAFADDASLHRETLQALPDPWKESGLTYSEFLSLAPGAEAEKWYRDGGWEVRLAQLKRDLGVERLEAGQVSPLIEGSLEYYRVAVEDADATTVRVLIRSWPKENFEVWLSRSGVEKIAALAGRAEGAPLQAPVGGYVLPELPSERAYAGDTRAASGFNCTEDTWRLLQMHPSSRASHTAVWTGTEMLVWGGSNRGAVNLLPGGRYDPATDSWLPISTSGAPTPRSNHRAVWTGTEMLIWGGGPADGSRYNPTSDSWAPMSQINQPQPNRQDHAAVWTGSQMLVWGGAGATDGGRYSPSGNSWTPVSSSGAAPSLPNSTGVWTGSEMIVWGGGDDSLNPTDTGARYNPVTDSWAGLPSFPLAARVAHTGVWSGSELIVFGGQSTTIDQQTQEEVDVNYGDGARYNPVSNLWSPTATANFQVGARSVWADDRMVVYGGREVAANAQSYDPVGNQWTTLPANSIGNRADHTVVWTGNEAIVWGGADPVSFDWKDSGARWNKVSNAWSSVARTATPPGRQEHTAVWTGAEMIVFGGATAVFLNGGRYDPATNVWAPLSTVNIPIVRRRHGAVWTGTEMIVWGGLLSETLNTGGRYNPATDSWIATSTIGAPEPRASFATTWTGSQMLIFGGASVGATPVGNGYLFNPATNVWSLISGVGAPSPRNVASAVWTGTEAIVWGGGNETTQFGDGGRYDPATARWTPMSNSGAPSARAGMEEVWTGSEMLIWGGSNAFGNQSDGAHYDPFTDSWTPMSATGAPGPRGSFASIWSGEEFIVWGGRNGGIWYNDGARYDPVSKTWSSMTSVATPVNRMLHTAVWTGTEMLIFGGRNVGFEFPDDPGGYCVSSSCPILDWFLDSDGDGAGDIGDAVQACEAPAGYVANSVDCDDGDGTIFTTPGETRNLEISHDPQTGVTTVGWEASAAPGGQLGSAVYDLLRSGSASDFSLATCVQSQSGALFSSDSTMPSAGAVLFYLSRASNDCPNGLGTLGAASDQTERTGAVCP